MGRPPCRGTAQLSGAIRSMSSAWRDWVRISWPMKSMELDFDVEVLEAAQPHGGSYLALVFTFVKSGRKIYRGSIFFLFHGNGGEFEGAGSGACYRGICLAPRTVFFFCCRGNFGGDGGQRVLW